MLDKRIRGAYIFCAPTPNFSLALSSFFEEVSTMARTLKCTARRMGGGQAHEHITHLWWQVWEDNQPTQENGVSTRDQMVAYIEKMGNESVWCPDRNPQQKGAWVHVNHNGRTKYVQTVADKRWTDNLLALPIK
ncbi:DUF3892 domain-containing protein [Burkholderia metallica]